LGRGEKGWPPGAEINAICIGCVKDCKQLKSIKLIFCPSFSTEEKTKTKKKGKIKKKKNG
jgi:TPP-dependent indolepyruvate ferredoxin oxidoreductase alpha subunit